MPSVSYVPRENESFEQYSVKHVGIARSFSVRKDSCNHPEHFTDYLLYNALNDAQSGMGVTSALIRYDENGEPQSIMGYITLKVSALLQDADEGFTGKPGIEISELAVDEHFEGQGIGVALLSYAVSCFYKIKETAGVMCMLVYAEPNAVGFYKHVLDFAETRDIYEIPHENWNASCVPMYLNMIIQNSSEPCYITDDNDDDDDWP